MYNDETFLSEISTYQNHIKIYWALPQHLPQERRPYQQLNYLHENQTNSRSKTTAKTMYLEDTPHLTFSKVV